MLDARGRGNWGTLGKPRPIRTSSVYGICRGLPSELGNSAAITIWRLKPFTNEIVSAMGAAMTIWRFIANDQSNRLPKFR